MNYMNTITTCDAYPIPRVNMLFETLTATCHLTIIDTGRVSVAQKKTVFITPFGIFKFTLMLFGVRDMPATFQRVINYLLKGLGPLQSLT